MIFESPYLDHFPAEAEKWALIPIPSPAGRRGRAVGAPRQFVYLEPERAARDLIHLGDAEMIYFNLLMPLPAFTFPLKRKSGPSSPSLLPQGEGGEESY